MGTGSAFPCPKRSASCTIFRHTKGLWMFDCGEGSQIQLHRCSLKPSQINKIFITHNHGDHLFGLQGLMCTIGMNTTIVEGTDTTEGKHVDIYGPVGLRSYLRCALRFSYSNLPYSYAVHEIEVPNNKEFSESLDIPHDDEFWQNMCGNISVDLPLHPCEVQGAQIAINEAGYFDVCVADGLTVKAALLRHTVPCVGYVIQEDDLPGKLDISILKSKGVPQGPLYGKIKSGESIQLESGEIVTPEDCVGPARKGRKIVILGDTYDSDRLLEIGSSPDVLVHESTNETADEEKSRQHGHSSARMTGLFAKKLGARKLVLTHFSQRYRGIEEEEKDGSVSVQILVDEAKQAYESNNVVAAHDLMVVPIPLPK